MGSHARGRGSPAVGDASHSKNRSIYCPLPSPTGHPTPSPLTPRREKAQELLGWIHQLESEKFDLMEKMKQQKYEVGGRGL